MIRRICTQCPPPEAIAISLRDIPRQPRKTEEGDGFCLARKRFGIRNTTRKTRCPP